MVRSESTLRLKCPNKAVGGVIWTQMGMGCAQAISAAWLTTKMQDHKRPIALAAYVMSIQLASFPGNQLFRQEGTSRHFMKSVLQSLTCYAQMLLDMSVA